MNELSDSNPEFLALAMDESSDTDSESHVSFMSALEEVSQVSHFCVTLSRYHDRISLIIYKKILDR